MIERSTLLCYSNDINSNVRRVFTGAAIICDNSYLEIYYYSNFTNNVDTMFGGAMVLNSCSLYIEGNASFVRNKAHEGGAILLYYTNSSINGNLFMNKNQAIRGGALEVFKGNIIIKGYALFMQIF